MSDLVATKHVDRHLARRGQRLRYRITVTNHGPDPATGVRLTDTPALPVRALSIHSGQGHCTTGPPLTCALGRLRSGAHTTITITVRTTAAGRQTNTAAVMSHSRDPHPHTNLAAATTRISAPPAPPPPRVTG